MKKTMPKHNWPEKFYMVSPDKEKDSGGLAKDNVDGSDEDIARCLTREEAIRLASGEPDYHEDGVVAVYQLVEIIEVRQRKTITSYPVAEAARKAKP